MFRVGEVRHSSVLTFCKSRLFTVSVPLGIEEDQAATWGKVKSHLPLWKLLPVKWHAGENKNDRRQFHSLAGTQSSLHPRSKQFVWIKSWLIWSLYSAQNTFRAMWRVSAPRTMGAVKHAPYYDWKGKFFRLFKVVNTLPIIPHRKKNIPCFIGKNKNTTK